MKNYHARRLDTLLRALRVAASGSVLLWLAVLPLQPAHAEVPRLAVFNFELLDTSLEGEVSGENEAEQQRLVMISDLLRQLLADSNRYEVVDIAPAYDKIAEAGYLRSCNGCDAAHALNKI